MSDAVIGLLTILGFSVAVGVGLTLLLWAGLEISFRIERWWRR